MKKSAVFTCRISKIDLQIFYYSQSVAPYPVSGNVILLVGIYKLFGICRHLHSIIPAYISKTLDFLVHIAFYIYIPTPWADAPPPVFTCDFLVRYSSPGSLFTGNKRSAAFYKLKHQPSTCTFLIFLIGLKFLKKAVLFGLKDFMCTKLNVQYLRWSYITIKHFNLVSEIVCLRFYTELP